MIQLFKINIKIGILLLETHRDLQSRITQNIKRIGFKKLRQCDISS